MGISGKITTLTQMEMTAARGLQAAGEVAQAAAEAIEEVLDVVKADKAENITATILATGWALEEADDADEEAEDETSNYPYYYDIAVEGVTAKDRAEVTVLPTSVEIATACGLCPTNETLAGIIRIRSVSVPSGDIVAECWIEGGKE